MRKSPRWTALITLVFVLAAQALHHAQSRVDVLIAFRNLPGAAEEALVRAAGGEVKHTFRIVHAIAARLPEHAVDALRRNPRISIVEPDVRMFAVDAELDNTWGVKRIGAGEPHAGGFRGNGVKVAVIDSGIDYNHPDLAANYAGGYDFVNNDADPFDDNQHGTHVAGTIAARDDDAGVIGVAPEARLYALKVLGANGSGSFSDVIAALQWAVDNGIQVTNMSFGSSQDPGSLVRNAFDNAAAAGILHIAAAGNSGTCTGTGENMLFPARYASVVAVAAVNSSDARPCFSSTGVDVELAAPGVGVNSTIPGGGYAAFNGTSMASPHVAGTAALVVGAGVADLNSNGRVNDEVRQILIDTAQDLGPAGRDTFYGHGLVNAAAAVTYTPSPPDPAVAVTVATNKTTYSSGVDTSAQVTVTVKDEGGAAIAGLAASSFATLVDGGARAVTFAETATPGTYTGSFSLSGLGTGAHSVRVDVTDTRVLTGSAQTSFSIAEPNTVRVSAINYSTYGGGSGKQNLVISVAVVNGAGLPQSGAIVSVMLFRNGFFYGAANGISNAAGNAVFEARNAPSGCYQTSIAAVLSGTRTWDGLTPPNSFCK
jgi:subtilisin